MNRTSQFISGEQGTIKQVFCWLGDSGPLLNDYCDCVANANVFARVVVFFFFFFFFFFVQLPFISFLTAQTLKLNCVIGRISLSG